MRNIFFTALIIVSATLAAQEGLRPLTANPGRQLSQPAKSRNADVSNPAARQQSTPLQLPFREDFYYSPLSTRPSVQLWVDTGALGQSVYVNSGFGIAPPSIGVATFDGLNANGYPYDPQLPNLTLTRPADALTSRPINLHVAGTKTLQPSDSVALTFFYQARGFGDNPESADSLAVDFYDANDSVWVRMWAQRGYGDPNVIDTAFRKAFIPVKDVRFFNEHFQFRIRNRATVAGDFDHWNVDYILLNQQQFNKAVEYNDLTFAYVPSSMLYQYSSMPFNQYRGNEMTDHYSVMIKNNKNSVIGMRYQHRIFDESGNLLHAYDGGPANLQAFADTGYSRVPAHSNINLSTSYTLPLMTDSTHIKVQHILSRDAGSGNDYIRENDTLWQTQLFRNYYAFDDGGAEAGYYVNKASGKMAVRVTLNEPDTFRALRIYFDPAGGIAQASEAGFRIAIWPAESSGPSATPSHSVDKVFKQTYYSTGEREIPEFKLPEPILLEAGTYYIGVQQQATTLTVGFDRNYDAHRNLYYDAGSGWKQSTIKGAIMMRPVFGRYIEPPVGVAEAASAQSFRLYPNPASDNISVVVDNGSKFSFTVIGTLGTHITSGNGTGAVNIDTSAMPAGIYYLLVNLTGKETTTRKFIISR